MYTGNDPSLSDLQAQLTALTSRVNSIDGQNLVNPSEGLLSQLQAKYEGLKSDLRQSVTLLEQILNSYKKIVAENVTLLKQHLGIS